MKEAISVFLGGETVEASCVELYSDYFNKGLICPFCLEKVFLAKGFERSINDKVVKVSASFKHHKGDPLSCELRSQTGEGKESLKAMDNDAKEQRKLLWEKYLWAMFRSGISENQDITGLKLKDVSRKILDWPVHKPCKLRIRNQSRSISVDELGAVLSICFVLLPFNLKHYLNIKEEIDWRLNDEEFEDAVKIEIDTLHELSNGIKQVINTQDFCKKTRIKCNPGIHFNVCMEVLQTLLNPNSLIIQQRILATTIVNINENYPINDSVWGGLCELWEIVKSSFLLGTKGTGHRRDVKTLQSYILDHLYQPFMQRIISIDWYELSQRNWKALAKQHEVLMVNTSGKGFAK